MKGVNELSFDLSKVGGSVSNFISSPHGTDYVSTIDDYERNTREHLVDCMRKISGYPEVDTLCISKWTSDTRPNGHSNGQDKVLIGYNTTNNVIEAISNVGAVLEIGKAISLIAHPVGSYYETSDANFNPNTAWGGTWVLDTPGRVMVSQGRKKDANNQEVSGSHNFADGEIGGNEVHMLVRPELPIHYHPHRHPHAHSCLGGNYVVTKTSSQNTAGYIPTTSSAQTDIAVSLVTETGLVVEKVDPNYSHHGMIDADTSDSATEDMLMHVGSAIGENGHNNLQPYKVCYRWHRTE